MKGAEEELVFFERGEDALAAGELDAAFGDDEEPLAQGGAELAGLLRERGVAVADLDGELCPIAAGRCASSGGSCGCQLQVGLEHDRHDSYVYYMRGGLGWVSG